MKEVARRAKVSIGTVSNVITGSAGVSARLRRKVQKAIRELDYHPNAVARSLKVRQTKIFGMVVSDITNPFFPQIVRGAEDAARERDYVLVIFNTDDQLARERDILSVLRARRVDGILLVVGPDTGDVSHILQTQSAGTPIVCLDRIPAGVEADSVSVDNVRGARAAVEHLIAMGHRRIGIITGARTLQTARDRLEGYKEALQRAGIAIDADFIREGDFRMESGRQLGLELLSRQRPPTALFTANAMMGIGVLRALDEQGLRCPDDLALVTFDDLPVSEVFRPRLTAVAQPAYDIGYTAAQLLIQRLEGTLADDRPVHVTLKTELKIRESSLPVRAGRD